MIDFFFGKRVIVGYIKERGFFKLGRRQLLRFFLKHHHEKLIINPKINGIIEQNCPTVKVCTGCLHVIPFAPFL